MKNIFKIILILSFITLITWASFHLTRNQGSKLLTGSILDGSIPGYIDSIEFILPRGTVVPQNNLVTITTVFIDFNVTGETAGYEDGNLSGSDIASSFIVFNGSALPAGVQIMGNQVITPSIFTDFTVDIYLPGGVVPVSSAPITITPPSCEGLRTSIMRGYGEGLYYGTDSIPQSADSSPFTFASASYESIVLSNTAPPIEFEHQVFQILLNFVPDIITDPENGISERAVITSNSGDGFYEISVRDEGDYTAGTAANFSYVFSNLIGTSSPFYAYITEADSSAVILTTKELGTHTNNYNCSYIADGIHGACFFAGGLAGDVDILTRPLVIDNTMTQDDTAFIYASGSVGVNTWISSHSSVLEVAPLAEAGEDDSIVTSTEFIPAPLTSTASYDKNDGSYSISGCEENRDESTDALISQTCVVDITIPVTYPAPSGSYSAIVNIDGEAIDVPVEISELSGHLSGTSTWVYGVGMSMSLTGEVNGTAEGYATGDAEGMVYGTVSADISGNANISDAVNPASIGVIQSSFPIDMAITAELLNEVAGTFNSTVRLTESEITNFAYLYAKRPGTSILTVTDEQGCTASMEIQVFEKNVILRMVNHNPSDIFEVGDTVQINAYLGSSNGEFNEEDNITSDSAIEWFSSNTDAVSVDGTGLITFVGPGTSNITARYDTGEAEIGTVESTPMQIRVSKITGLTIALDEETQSLLPAEDRQNAYQSVVVVIHSPDAVGRSITIEGETIDIVLPVGTYSNDIERIEGIVSDSSTGLINTLAVQNSIPEPEDVVRITSSVDFPGIMIMRPINQDYDSDADEVTDINENGIIDISTTATNEEISIIPNFGSGINLPSSEIYGLMAIAEYDSGRTKRLSAIDVIWVNTPVNYLERASLDTGLLRFGEITGTSVVNAQFQNTDGFVITSNELSVTVGGGPIIESIRRIGSGTITKGSQINIQMKISDIDTVEDIKDLSISLVKSDYDTYDEIDDDSDAIWFDTKTYIENVIVEGGEDETEGESDVDASQYKTYNLPVSIPVDENLFDGNYKLVVSVSDSANHTTNYVYSIYIGRLSSGDVNGDGTSNMIDVIVAFQIAAGNITPSQAQLEAANIDHKGGVTMIDVILLFNQIISS